LIYIDIIHIRYYIKIRVKRAGLGELEHYDRNGEGEQGAAWNNMIFHMIYIMIICVLIFKYIYIIIIRRAQDIYKYI